jgi:hypothetical protein
MRRLRPEETKCFVQNHQADSHRRGVTRTSSQLALSIGLSGSLKNTDVILAKDNYPVDWLIKR